MATRNKDRRESGSIKQPLCPYLARFDAQQKQVAPVDHPSFENHCFATQDEAALLLTDQATFCLSGSYRLCERFLTVQLEEEALAGAPFPSNDGPGPATIASSPQPMREEPWTQPLFQANDSEWLYRPNRRIWTWASAAVIFVAVLLMGGGMAAYMGWQMVLQGELLARAGQSGQINLLETGQTPAQPPAFLVVTAIPQLPESAQTEPPQPAADAQTGIQPNGTAQRFPEAVTPTPIVLVAPGAETNPQPGTSQLQGQSQGENGAQPSPPAVMTPANLLLPTVASGATPEAVINLLQEVPTRRPTPLFELPTSTPVSLVEPTATATLAILGTPVVIFAADEAAVPPGECTKVRWLVANVREVYYEGQPSLGEGSQEECIKKEADTYALRVVFGDGQTQIFTTTVDVLWPTPTVTLTPSFTPEPLATETWTPVPQTPTPTSSVIRAVTLRINGEKRQTCSAGATCEFNVLVTNLGDHPDNLAVEFLQRGSDNSWLCRQDGQCADQRLSLTNVGQGNTAFVVLRVTLPVDNVGTVFTYLLRATSDGSQGAVTSEAVTLEIESQAP